MVCAGNRAFFRDENRERSYLVYIQSILETIPPSLSKGSVESIDVEILSEDEWYLSQALFERIPEKTGHIMEVSIKARSGGVDFGLGVFVSKSESGYCLLVPDVTELWRVE